MVFWYHPVLLCYYSYKQKMIALEIVLVASMAMSMAENAVTVSVCCLLYLTPCQPLCIILFINGILVFVTVPLCLSLFPCVCHCSLVFVTVPLCLSLFPCVCHCSFVFVTVPLCLSLFPCVCHCSFVFVTVPLCLSLFPCACNCLSLVCTP